MYLIVWRKYPLCTGRPITKMSMTIALLISSLLMLTSSAEKACLPVFIIHGVLQPAIWLTPLKNTIEKSPDCPNGRNVTIIYEEEVLRSIIPVWEQVKVYQKFLQPYFQSNPDGIHIIGYSQGAIIARAVVQTTDNHTVRTLVSIAGAQTGFSGLPIIQTDFLGLNNLTRSLKLLDIINLWLPCYTPVGQSTFCLCNHWRDERHFDLYKKFNIFLPYINNEIEHPNFEQYKNNFLAIRKFVLIATKDDEVISPWQSGIFGSRNINDGITDMKDQEIYKNDSFGLKTMNDAGNLIMHITSGVEHLGIPNNITVINDYIIPYLD